MLPLNNSRRKILISLLSGGATLAAAIAGAFLTVPHEGKVNHTYLDPGGVVTACYGHTGPKVKLGQKYTDEECLKFLLKDLGHADKVVQEEVKVPLNLYQRVALDDFVYNVGETNFRNSTLLKLFNKGDYVNACNQLSRWVYDNKKKLGELVRRRADELRFCLGDFTNVRR